MNIFKSDTTEVFWTGSTDSDPMSPRRKGAPIRSDTDFNWNMASSDITANSRTIVSGETIHVGDKWFTTDTGTLPSTSNEFFTTDETPRFPSKTPGFTSTTPGFTSTTPGFTSTTPGFISTTPGFISTTTGFTSTTPEFTSTTPGFTSTTPGFTSTATGFISETSDFTNDTPSYTDPSRFSSDTMDSSSSNYIRVDSDWPDTKPTATSYTRTLTDSSRSDITFTSDTNWNATSSIPFTVPRNFSDLQSQTFSDTTVSSDTPTTSSTTSAFTATDSDSMRSRPRPFPVFPYHKRFCSPSTNSDMDSDSSFPSDLQENNRRYQYACNIPGLRPSRPGERCNDNASRSDSSWRTKMQWKLMQPGVCTVMAQSWMYVVRQLGVDDLKDLFDSQYDQCFCVTCNPQSHVVEKWIRGGERYMPPFGWCRFGLNPLALVERFGGNVDYIARMFKHSNANSNQAKDWPVAFHCPSPKAIRAILNAGHLMESDQRGILLSPSVRYCRETFHLAANNRSSEIVPDVALQVRVKPGTYQKQPSRLGSHFSESNIPTNKLEWNMPDGRHAIIYALLVRPVFRSPDFRWA